MNTRTLVVTRRAIIVIILSMLVLAACDNQRDATPTPIPPQPAPALGETPVAVAQTAVAATPVPTPVAGNVVLWHSWAQAEGDALAAVLTDLRVAYPNLQVDTLFVAPDDLVATYGDAVQAGSGPDLVIAPNWWLTDMVAGATVLPLDELLPPAATDEYWPAALASMRQDGRLYGLPVSYSTVALLVNTALAEADDIPKTTTDLLEGARTTSTLGIGLYANLFHAYWGFPAFGAQLLDEQGKVVLDQSAGSAEYLAYLASLNEIPGSYVNQDYGMLLDRFKKGEFAFFVDGPWAIVDLRAGLGDTLQVASLPAGPAGAAQPWLYADGVFLNPSRPESQRELALLVAEELTGSAAGATLAQIGGLLPAAHGVDLSTTPLLQGFANEAATSAPMPLGEEMREVWGYGGDMFVKTLAGVAPPPAIVAETTALINEANGK